MAFAKIGPFLRLEETIKTWIGRGKKIEAIFGIDEKGTSLQALDFALRNFTVTHIARFSKHSFNSTFHPKVYIFTGNEKGVAYIGSNNFTVGGLETNAESNVKVEFDINADQEFTSNIQATWNSTFEVSRKLDESLLSELLESGLILDEKEMTARRMAVGKMAKTSETKAQPEFPVVLTRPPSPIPKKLLIEVAPAIKDGEIEVRPVTEALVIQIIPHQNGEILLSKLAVDQNPEFFGWPFTGKTVPKKETNPSYPQREPDPVVNIAVYDTSDKRVFEAREYSLNTVYYETKSEIRITVPQEVIKNTPEYSVLVMSQNAVDEGLDYDIEIFIPGSSMYEKYLASCNQSLPTGGRDVARRFGWI